MQGKVKLQALASYMKCITLIFFLKIFSSTFTPPSPVTAAIILRPKTTTISERAELNMEETGEEEEVVLEEADIQPHLQPHKLKRSSSRSGLELAHRQLSRNITEDDEDIIKIKEYMEQKGL